MALHHRKLRLGLTLVELIVVLVILVALAGIVIPLFPGMIGRSHSSTSATNCAEVNKAIQSYEQLYLGYPDDWDSLTVGTAIATYVPGNSGKDLETLTIPSSGDSTSNALAAVGITRVFTFHATPAAPTFHPYGADATVVPTGVVLNTEGGTLAQLTAGGKAKLGGKNIGSAATYVVLGLGKLNSMVGKSIADAPIHFSDKPNAGPQAAYERFAAIFRTTHHGGGALDRALLVAVVALHDDGISTGGMDVEEHYKIVKDTQQ